jgi:catechol 2,3-dioxygenase-like lactoylglutathione lyase family enzyme
MLDRLENALNDAWPDDLAAVQVRIARPTDQLDAVVRFYVEGLGLPRIGGFSDHAGYDGVMIGLPGRDYHLEFTQHIDGSPCPAPSRDNLLVFYVPDREAIARTASRLRSMGHDPVEPENPYWLDKARTFEDPDGWRIVLMNTEGI